jgi:hypothetical protein
MTPEQQSVREWRETAFSPCRKYRYTLWREWWKDQLPRPMCRDCADVGGAICPNDGHRCDPSIYLQVIGLNPSTADEVQDDPTIRRCIDFAKQWGFGALCMTNIFAYRATDPLEMKRQSNPQGIANDMALIAIAQSAGLIVAAWGTHGAHLNRGNHVVNLLGEFGYKIHCLGKNADGSPKHPLYLPKSVRPELL